MKPVCIVCSFRPLTILGHLLGFSPIAMTCSTKLTPCTFSPSFWWIFLSLLQNIFVTSIMLINVILLTPEWLQQHFQLNIVTSDMISRVFEAIEFLQFFTATMLLSLNVLQCRSRASALGKIAKYLHHRGPGVERSITQQDESRLFWMAVRQASTIFIILISNIIYVYFMWPENTIVNEENITWWVIVKTFSNGVCTLMVLMAGFEVSLVMTLFRMIILNLDKQLRTILYSANMRENTSIDSNNNISIFHRIVRIRRSHMKVIESIVDFNGSVNPQLALLTCLVMISTVLNSYIAGQYAINSSQTTTRLLVTCMRLFINITITLYMIYKADQVLQMNDLMFRLVTSVSTVSLNVDELIQLELLSQQISKSPPLFSASGIFDFNAGMVAKMFSTAITYIIVALQFDIRIFTETIEAVSR